MQQAATGRFRNEIWDTPSLLKKGLGTGDAERRPLAASSRSEKRPALSGPRRASQSIFYS